MEDLIKRDDAIKVASRECHELRGIFSRIEKGINSLPSADTDLSEYSDKLWKNAYERGKADRPQGDNRNEQNE